MSNFTFLKTDWPELYETAREAEQNVNSALRTSCFYARCSLERVVKWLCANESYLKQLYANIFTVSIPIFSLHISTTNKIFTP